LPPWRAEANGVKQVDANVGTKLRQNFAAPLRVALDLRGTETGFKAHSGRGTGRYVNELVRAFGDIESPDIKLQFFGSKEISPSAWERTLVNLLPKGKITLEQQILMPPRLAKLGCDFVHFFAHGDAPAWNGFSDLKYLVTVLDLIPLRFPDLYKADRPDWRFQLARYLELNAIRKSQGIIAISEATKRDLIELLQIEAEDIVVTPLAASPAFKPLAGGDAARLRLREELGISAAEKILLYVGGIDARKNVDFLFGLMPKILLSEPNARLVLVGNYKSDDRFENLSRKALQLSERINFSGFASEEVLLNWYRACDVFVFPSIYEGFGLPVLEAMASGAPLVAGNNSAIPEVTGTEYPLCRDMDEDDWVRQILSRFENNTRARLSELGLRRAELFSWKRTASETLTAYGYFASRKK
jgi:glycosyltransferase involved in cell wall biosynthesis